MTPIQPNQITQLTVGQDEVNNRMIIANAFYELICGVYNRAQIDIKMAAAANNALDNISPISTAANAAHNFSTEAEAAAKAADDDDDAKAAAEAAAEAAAKVAATAKAVENKARTAIPARCSDAAIDFDKYFSEIKNKVEAADRDVRAAVDTGQLLEFEKSLLIFAEAIRPFSECANDLRSKNILARGTLKQQVAVTEQYAVVAELYAAIAKQHVAVKSGGGAGAGAGAK